jgi:hypothetical protein
VTSIENCPTANAKQTPARSEAGEGEPHIESAENPWLQLAGIFADDPTLMPMLDAIYAARDADRDALDAAQ